MAPRQTARRLLVAAPALALALAVTACSPPNEQPANPDAPYTLPTYSEEPKATEAEQTTTGETTTALEGAESEGVAPQGAEGTAVQVPGQPAP
ncbi:hypothetical protein [Dietzia sp. UBA5065]|jgi:ABC-type oligopeptide transport system substrate-binding subunit|uniref:hypothetical protein n=1 Tax=Dietzia sp. UBA5065 TaxID=1946422 RepID=UPI0025BCA4EE|nr:hypothetical protein [Dietzia sp. UBA5065]HMT49794.1 hypothetical protein [Dietzia sp.]